MNQDIYSNQHIVIGDDFNLVFDKDINNRKSKFDVLKIMDTLSLKDVFREHNRTLNFLISQSLPHLSRALYVKYETITALTIVQLSCT